MLHTERASDVGMFVTDGQGVPSQGDTRLEDDWVPDQDTRSLEEIEESNREKEAKARWDCSQGTAAPLQEPLLGEPWHVLMRHACVKPSLPQSRSSGWTSCQLEV